MSAIHQDPRQAAALRELRGRGEIQHCITCDRVLFASARRPDKRAITVGHFTPVDLQLTDPFDPASYGPQCQPCNSSEGAQYGNAKRAGHSARELTVSPDWT